MPGVSETIRLLTCALSLSWARVGVTCEYCQAQLSAQLNPCKHPVENKLSGTGTEGALIGQSARAVRWGAECPGLARPPESDPGGSEGHNVISREGQGNQKPNFGSCNGMYRLGQLGPSLCSLWDSFGQVWASGVAWNCRCAGPNAVTRVSVCSCVGTQTRSSLREAPIRELAPA